MNTYKITYVLYDADNKIIKDGVFKAKNQFSEAIAKSAFEKFLRKKHKNFSRLVISFCECLGETKKQMNAADFLKGNKFNDLFGDGFGDMFGDMFGGNPNKK
jgi:hypothetical protein